MKLRNDKSIKLNPEACLLLIMVLLNDNSLPTDLGIFFQYSMGHCDWVTGRLADKAQGSEWSESSISSTFLIYICAEVL